MKRPRRAQVAIAGRTLDLVLILILIVILILILILILDFQFDFDVRFNIFQHLLWALYVHANLPTLGLRRALLALDSASECHHGAYVAPNAAHENAATMARARMATDKFNRVII